MSEAELPGALGVDYDVITLLDGSIWRTHGPVKCQGHPCPVHSPSDHHMTTWPLYFRADTGVTERMCPHGVGHPDPDYVAYAYARWGEADGRALCIHGCDGCCATDAGMRQP